MTILPPSMPLRVLLVEDSPDDASLILRELKKGGFEPEAQRVASPEALKHALTEATWDLVLSDFRMPGFGGRQALRVVQEQGLDLPFIVLSGAIGEEMAVSLMKEGAHDCIFKENLGRLGPAIARELKEARTRREERAAREALQASEERYRDLYEHLPIPTWVVDCSGLLAAQASAPELSKPVLARCAAALRVLEMNASSASFFGIDRQAPEPAAFSRILGEESWPAFRAFLQHLREGHRVFEGEMPLVDLQGRPRTAVLHASVSPGFEVSLSRVVLSFMDVTERVAMESSLRESRASLERAQAMARLGSWEWDLSRRIPTWSAQLFGLLGVDPLSGPLDYDAYLARVHPDDRVLVLGTRERVISEGVSQGMEYRLLGSDEAILHVFEQTELVCDSAGQPRILRGTIQDITERKRMAAELKDMSLLSAKGRMAAYIAHEINNPLAGIKNAIDLLARAIPPEHPHASYASLVRREIDRIAGIIRTIYHVYRPPTSETREVSIAQTFQDIDNLLLPKCRAAGVELKVASLAQDVKLVMNEGLLRQVLFNLVLNAIEASPQGGCVTLSATQEGAHAILRVTDEGHGIPDDLSERIFEPGFTTKRGGNMSGLGLGLSTCRSLVESMGGELSFCRRSEGQGTHFLARFPLADETRSTA